MHSKGQIDRAGKTLRRALTRDEPLPLADDLAAASDIAEAFRKAHRASTVSARMGLKSCIASTGLEVIELSQRLKRLPTVIDKLRRLPTMKLSNMGDIGGCRAVFDTQEEVARVQERFMANSAERNGAEDTVRDYVTEPRESGYRAVHLWTRYGDRRIEVQLRTRMQHDWAMLVEDITVRTGTDYKSGGGSDDVHRWLQLLSAAASFEEAGLSWSSGFEQDYAVARLRAQLHLDAEVRIRRQRHG